MARVDLPQEPSRTRRRLATAVALVGIAVVGGQLAKAWPREVEVAYRPDIGVHRLDVDIVLDGEAIASARFRRLPDDTTDVLHTVSLPPGQYEARITVYGPDGAGTEHLRALTVPAAGLVRVDLRSP
ncbi:MAG: hypothetical protein AAF436_07220 [Myxococcota bacterium]